VKLVRYITEQAAEAGHDYIGSSFGASTDLLQFWAQPGWLPVRLSIQPGASSGQHSVVLLKALSGQGKRLVDRARERFFAHFPHQLSDSLRELEPQLVCAVMRNDGYAAVLSADDWRDVEAFALQRRLPEVAIGALWRLCCMALQHNEPLAGLDEDEKTLLVARVLQQRGWQDCARAIAVPGRGAALAVLRRAVAKLIRYYAGKAVSSNGSHRV
jgi:tRNA(Met) cytidine acetyltransferase